MPRRRSDSPPRENLAVSQLEATPDFWPVHLVLLSASKLFDLGHDAIELVDEIGVIAMFAKRGHERAVIPERALLLTGKPLENFRPMPSQFGQDSARIMQFIGR